MHDAHVIRTVRVGKLAPLGSRRVLSGIEKKPVEGRVRITFAGLEGDECGDKKHHGGPEKAIHHYPFDHYASWRCDHPELGWRLKTDGAFGENISTEGMTEASVCVGDILRLGTALVQVSQGRQPCWRLNIRFDQPRMARWVQDSGRTGWYYRVLEQGEVGPGDCIELVDRLHADWTLRRILYTLYIDSLNARALAGIGELPELADAWRRLARRRLERAEVEDWTPRITTPD